jgi:hypothetical protein
MKHNLTKRQKFIAAAAVPTTYGGGVSRQEVKDTKLLARGHYWDEGEDYDQYCAYSPTGRRKYFTYNWFSWGTKKQKARWKQRAKQAARFWAEGRYELARIVIDTSYEYRHSR